APDYETRVAILRRKAEERGASFGPGVLEAVADAPLTNVRELMGAVNRLMAHQAVNDSPIDGEAAKRLLGIGAAAPPPGAPSAAGGGGGGGGIPPSPPPAPSPAFPLSAYAVGPSNQVAVSAVRAVLERPGKKYSPLVLVGHSGCGKTHLLNALGLELAHANGAIVACLSTQAFIDELIAAIDANRVDWWRARYRRVTALLLDDVHLVAGKERTQEELFNLFNLLQDRERQLVFTAPAPPNTLAGIEERIASRLEGGLVVELKAPDRDVKRAVVERILTQQDLAPEPPLLDYLADRPADSVRSLVAAVQRVMSAAGAQDVPVTVGL